MSTTQPGNVALLIDWENIKHSSEDALKTRPDVLTLKKFARRYGAISLAKAYANWSDRWHEGDASRLALQGIDPVFVMTKRYRPDGERPQVVTNLADVRLACDAVEVALTHHWIDTVVLVSGDGSLEAAIEKLAAAGKRVIRLAVSDSVSRYLYVAREEVVYYDDLLVKMKVAAHDPGLAQALDRFRDSVLLLRSKKAPHDLKSVKTMMKSFQADFNEEALGIPTFRHLAYIAEAQGFARIDACRGEPASAYGAEEMQSAEGARLHSGQKWAAFIRALDPTISYVKPGLSTLIKANEIYTSEEDVAALLDAAEKSEIIWARDRAYYNDRENRKKHSRDYYLNTLHPRVQVARS